MKMLLKDRNITVTEDNKKFYRKDKKLSAYSFVCGYIEVYESTIKEIDPCFGNEFPLVKVIIEKDGCYHVKMYHNDYGLLGHLSSWESFDTLTEARKYCGALLKEIQKIAIQA